MSTIAQDPICRFTLRIEQLRALPDMPGVAGLLHGLMREIFIALYRLLASFAERRRAGTLAGAAPACAPASSRVSPPDLSARHSGRLVQRTREHARGGGMMHRASEQAREPIAETPPVAGISPPPRRARVRNLKDPSALAPLRPLHADDGDLPRWREAWVLPTMEAGFLRLDSKKSVWAGGGFICPECYDLATIAGCRRYRRQTGTAGHPSPCPSLKGRGKERNWLQLRRTLAN